MPNICPRIPWDGVLPLSLEHSIEISQCMLALKAYVKMESEKRNIHTYTSTEKIPS